MVKSMNRNNRSLRQQGFSLIELMIAMVVGLVLMTGVISVFSSSQKSFNLTQEISTIQESARFALSAISHDIRMGSFQGCAMASQSSAIIRTTSTITDDFLKNSIRGSEINGATASPQLPLELQTLDPAPRSGSDILMVQYASATTSRLAADMTTTSDTINMVNNNTNLSSGDLAIISDCEVADLFTVTNLAGNVIQHQATGNTSGNLSKAYKPGTISSSDTTRVAKFNYTVYYIGDSGRTNEAGNTIYSLYSYDMVAIKNGDDPAELIEGIENMQLLYGVAETNGLVKYVSADSSDFEPSDVTSIQVGLLIGSIEELAENEDTQTYQLLNAEIAPTGGGTAITHPKDYKIRMAFNTTVKIRNRRGGL